MRLCYYCPYLDLGMMCFQARGKKEIIHTVCMMPYLEFKGSNCGGIDEMKDGKKAERPFVMASV